MRTPGTIIARLFFALALIVQIVAPVASSVAMVTAATDPLVDIVVCAQDLRILDRQGKTDPGAQLDREACALCQLVAAGGFAPPPTPPTLVAPAAAFHVADWARRVESVVAVRLLDHIRGRAPPTIS